MSPSYLWYQVRPTEQLPEGMQPITLTVLSPVWQGPEITIVFPDGWEQILQGRTADGKSCGVKIFWTEAATAAPPVCLAIGGDGGLSVVEGQGGMPESQHASSTRPFLALAPTLIPRAVQEVIGPEPPRSRRLLL